MIPKSVHYKLQNIAVQMQTLTRNPVILICIYYKNNFARLVSEEHFYSS
jgi:hypothetical protein